MALKKVTRPSRRSTEVGARLSARARRQTRAALTLLLALAALCGGLAGVSVWAQSGAGTQGGGATTGGARGASVRPKRPTPRLSGASARDAKAGRSAAAATTSSEGATAMGPLESDAPILASADFNLIGLAVAAGPVSQTVPKNTPTQVLTSINAPGGMDVSALMAGLNSNYRVRGELVGPSLGSPRQLEAPIGEPLAVPALSRTGEHVVQNLRVVDIGQPEETVVAPVSPDACGIVVFDRLLVSEVRVNELSYEQILQAGINITADSYRAFNFTLGLATTSDAQSISIPVAFPPVGVQDPRPIVGTPSVSAPGVDVPTVVPVMLTVEDEEQPEEGGGGEPPMLGEEPIRIPGVIVFPGRVGFLNQFFEAIVIVSNGAPNGTPLVIRNLRAKAQLPDAGTPAVTADDPLRIAERQEGGRISELDLHGLGPDEKYGTSDDTTSFTPGQSGQATFLLEGLKEGLHTVNFGLEATLEGLPSGPVKVTGSVPGSVLVRDASFGVTFTHPSVVRAGQEYDLAMTVYNSGSRDILGAFARLTGNSISGAELVKDDAADTGKRDFPTTIKRKDSATVKWRLRASTTGAVTASYVKIEGDVSGGLQLVTGVGDRNVPLSPDSLILPDPVRHLPPGVIEAARGVLGQAWSVANAPAGSLPQGVTPITKQAVIDRAVELGIAGMRVDFGEPASVSLDTLVRDWLGELKPNEGFADALRATPAGNSFYDAVGLEVGKRLSSATSPQTPAEFQQEFAAAEMPRSAFVSALMTQAAGAPVAGVRLVDSAGKPVGFGAVETEARAVDLPTGAALQLLNSQAATLGQLALVSKAAEGVWTVEIQGWRDGSVDLSLLYPGTGRTYRHVNFGGVEVRAGGKYRVRFTAGGTAAATLEAFVNNAWQAVAQGDSSTVNQPAPRLVGAIQVTPDVVSGGDKYGRLVGLLFSKPMLREQAEAAARYTVGGGQLKGTQEVTGGPVAVRGAKADYGDRFVFLSLDSPIGPYIRRDVTVSSLSDAQSMTLSPSPTARDIQPRVSPQGKPPGAYMTGRVLNADGTPVAGAPVVYWVQECPNFAVITLPPPPTPIAIRHTDAQGRYAFDYVRDGDCAPLSVTVNNPLTKAEKRLTSPVAYDGQHMVFDMVFLARGGVRGQVTSGGNPVPKAFVQVVPQLDVVAAKVVQADDTGSYSVEDIPVGNVSVIAVGTGDLRTASGLAAGNIGGPNQTAVVNVSLQNVSGSVTGRVLNPDGTPQAGALVVAYARIAGFGSHRADGATAVGYAYADRDGLFVIRKLPVTDITLELTDYVTGLHISQKVQLTTQAPELTGVLLRLPGKGTVVGRVLDERGQPVIRAQVRAAGAEVMTDGEGFYTLQGLRAGQTNITATDPSSGMSGGATTTVRLGEITTGVNITILRPAAVEGRVYIVEQGSTTPKPLAGAKVTSDGVNIVETNAQGAYRLERVQTNAPAIIRFVDAAKALAVNMQVILSPGETLTRDATLRGGRVEGHVYQPDGATGVIADVAVYAPRPVLIAGPAFGLLDTGTPSMTRSAADGSYSVGGLNAGTFRVSTSNVFFPTVVSAGGSLPVGGVAVCDLTLVSTFAGKIQGRVFQVDGTTPVGAGVRVSLSGGSLAEVTVRTDETGHYEFAEVFSAGGYSLTATDPVTGYTNRIGVSVQKNKDAVFDLRLLGQGGLRVKVVDGAGQPLAGGSVTLDGTSFPHQHRFAEVAPDGSGLVVFNNLPEGSYGVAATDRGLGGRASVNVPHGSTVEATIQLQATGTVEGRVVMPGGTTPVGLADVELRVGGRSVGFAVTSDDEWDRGRFKFLNVPAGDFQLDAFDNRTGRAGRTAARVTAQGETVLANVELIAVGAVAGRVTANGQPVDHALVEIHADGSGVSRANLKATTDADGRYRFAGIPAGRFTVSVSHAPGGQTGSVTGTISGTIEPLPDTIADVVLEASQTVNGTIYRAGGTEPVPGSQVTVFVGSRSFRTATNEAGAYRIGFVPLGQVRVRAEAPTGYDRGESALVPGTEPGATVQINVTLAGTGDLSGLALDHAGAPLRTGTVTFTNDAWGSVVRITAPVQSDGRYEVSAAPAGEFSLKLAVPDRVGGGSASGTVVAGQSLSLNVQLENAGAVRGRLLSEAGAPVNGADVTLTLARATGGTLRFYTHSNALGVFSVENIPLGTVSVAAHDPTSGGLALAPGLALAANGQTLDAGDLRLDATPIRVESVEPADGASNVAPVAAKVVVSFNEPALASTVGSGTVRLLRGTSNVNSNVSLSADGRVATLTPAARLADTTAYTVVVSQTVRDLNGHTLAGGEFRSTFTTADATAPTVAGVSPANDASRVARDGSVTVIFNEPLDPAQPLTEVFTLAPAGGQPVAASYTRGDSNRTATLTPSAAMSEGTRYHVNVAGQRDPAGNVQAAAFTSTFTTVDQTPPVIDPLPIDGQRVRTFRPNITAAYRDNLSGVKVSTVVLTVDGVDVTAGANVGGTGLSYTPAAPLARGNHSVTLRVADDEGNVSDTRTAAFEIDDSGPIITAFTVAGQPAADGMHVTSTLQPVVSVVFSDDTGADRAATKLLFGSNGAEPQPVASTVTDTELSYQPPSPLAEGQYTVEAVIVNSLGTATRTPRVTFNLDVDAPEILSVTPASGPQHGGTAVTLTGNRLLSGTSAQGLTGHYFDNIDFTGAEVLRIDPEVNFDWGLGSPDASIGPDQFTARWTGKVQAQTTETYTFYTVSDDGVRLYVNNQLIINNWTDHALTENSATIALTAGQKYDIRMEGYENGNHAVFKLLWATPTIPKQVVPQSALSSAGVTPRITVGGAEARVVSVTPGTPDTVVVETPAGAPGPADVEVTTDRGRGVAAGGFTYLADARTPFAREPDTLVLWHLDETGNGAVRVNDAAGHLYGTADADSTAQPGRFVRGRARTDIASARDIDNILVIGDRGFTAECWFKTGAVGRTYTLVGKDNATNGSAGSSYGDFSLQVMPAGVLRAIVHDVSGIQWKAEMSPAVMRVDDNQWHYAALVLDRTNARLSIYVDGVERAFIPTAAMKTVVNNDYPLRAGHYDSSGPVTNTGTPFEFPGTLDEIRLSSTAHSPGVIEQTYLGAEGSLGLSVLKAAPSTLPRGTTVTLDVSGYNLAHVAASAKDAAGAPQQVKTVYTSANAARFEVVVSPAAALGGGQLVLSSPAGTVTRQLLFVEVGQSPFGVESDTRLLWHLEEAGGTRVFDSSPYSIDGTADADATVVAGRFGRGRKRADLASDPDSGIFTIGTSSFTAECWVKTAPVERTYTLVGKDNPTNGSAGSSYGDFSLQIMPGGSLRAIVHDVSGIQWKAQMPSTVYDVDDDQWHAVAMVLDRGRARLSVYVDGVERAWISTPGMQPVVNNDYRMRAGHYDSSGPVTNTGTPFEFPGTLDEIRFSLTAHTPERLRADYEGNAGLAINSVFPAEAARNKSVAQRNVTTVAVDGYDLSGVTGRVERQGQVLDVSVAVAASSYRAATLDLGVAPGVVLGPARLILSKPGQPDTSAGLYITERSEFVVDNDTVVLWRLDEAEQGVVTIKDSGALSIDGRSDADSRAVEGRFLGGRTRTDIAADKDFGALAFGNRSFTAECWVKTGPVDRTYTLVGKDNATNGSAGSSYGDFSLQIMPGGSLRAIVHDVSGIQWKAEMSPTAFDVDDDRWHHVALVLDRERARLSVYADGVERAFIPTAAMQPMVNNDYVLRAGHYDSSGPVTNTGTPFEFPGALDEIRVSSTAHSPERIQADALGYSTIRLTRILPSSLQRGTADVPVVITGNGLTGSTLTADRPEVGVNVTAVTATQINALVTVPAAAAIGPVTFTATDTLGQTASVSSEVVDQKPFANAADDGNGTLVLWHLDEETNGGVPFPGSGDPVPVVIGGTPDADARFVPGRFGFGKTRADIAGSTQSNNIALGTSSFTAECWVKTGPVDRTYTLVGKDNATNGSAGSSYGDFSLQIMPGGSLRAIVHDVSGIQWRAEMGPKTFDPTTGQWLATLDDDRWHYVAMVLDRGAARLSVYVDGVERTFISTAAMQPVVTNTYPFRAGHYDSSGPVLSTGSPFEFPGTLDEIRVLRLARTAADIRQTWTGAPATTTSALAGGAGAKSAASVSTAQEVGTPTMGVTSLTPAEVERDGAAARPLATEVVVAGSDLKDVSARFVRGGEAADVKVKVLETSEQSARLQISVGASTPLGLAQLVLSKQGRPDAVALVRVTEPSEFAAEPDTALLLHLDETEHGATRLTDAGAAGLEFAADAASRANRGRFGGGRSHARAATTAPLDPAQFAGAGLTAEGWFQTGPVGREYVLVGKGTNRMRESDWALSLLPTGALRAVVYDASGVELRAETSDAGVRFDDGRWHSAALVLDREGGILLLYVDGLPRATAQVPAGFGLLRSFGQSLQLGVYDADAPAAEGPEAFPGLLDEVRVSTTAHTPDKIGADFWGHDAPSVTNVRPASVGTLAPPTRVVLSGYGLAGAKLQPTTADLKAVVKSSTRTSVELLVNAGPKTPVGTVRLELTDPSGRTAAFEINVVAGAGARAGGKGTLPARAASPPAARPERTIVPPPPSPAESSYGLGAAGGRGGQR